MKRTVLTTVAAATLAFAAVPAVAGNTEAPVIEAAPAPVFVPAPVASTDWGGFYAGGSLGFADVGEDNNNFDDEGVTYGLHAGYDYDLGNFVVGGEFELSFFDVSNGVINVDSVARAKLRAGYDAGAFLPYVTAGFAQLNTGGALDVDDSGAFYGLGVDYKLADNIRVGGELLQHEFDDFDGQGLNLDATTASVRASFEF